MPTPRRTWRPSRRRAVRVRRLARGDTPAAGAGAAKTSPAGVEVRPRRRRTGADPATEFETAQPAFSHGVLSAAKDDAERQKLVKEKYPQPEKYAPRLSRFAEELPTTRQARRRAGVGRQLARTAARTSRRGAAAALDPLRQERQARSRSSRRWPTASRRRRSRSSRRSPRRTRNRAVKGAATYSRWASTDMNRDNQAEAEKRFEEVIANYGDVAAATAARSATRRRRNLHEIRNLAIGKAAPEIEGEDVDGKKFKLSDYRGKVVVLDFWGDW